MDKETFTATGYWWCRVDGSDSLNIRLFEYDPEDCETYMYVMGSDFWYVNKGDNRWGPNWSKQARTSYDQNVELIAKVTPPD